MNVKKIENDGIVSKGLNMALECDKLEKEERMKCVSEDSRANREYEGNVSLNCGRETLEKSVSEVAKERESNNNCEEGVQHKHDEQWELIVIEARFFFKHCTPSMIKCIAGINMHVHRIRKIYKFNATVVYPECLRMKIGIML